MKKYFLNITRAIAAFLMRAFTGVQVAWHRQFTFQKNIRDRKPRVYVANHTSHGDFVLIWACLPQELRKSARPVAAADYWLKNNVRRFFGIVFFNAVLIDRKNNAKKTSPVETMLSALDNESALILFPEGTRNTTDAPLLELKKGIYKVVEARPEIEVVPVWINNLNRMLPKGKMIPLPLICTLVFGEPIFKGNEENGEQFMARLRDSLLHLANNMNENK